jgi:hypothetical protein
LSAQPFAPTLAVEKGWLVAALYPQPVQGYLLRQAGELPAWPPDARTKASLAKLPESFSSISVTDPRPGVRNLLNLAPLFATMARNAGVGFDFDVSLIPNAHAATRHLFPNVSVTTTAANVVRGESLTSVTVPYPLAMVGDNPTALLIFGSTMWLGRRANATFERVEPNIRPVPPPERPKPPE